MKPIYRIVAYSDNECTKMCYCKTTYNKQYIDKKYWKKDPKFKTLFDKGIICEVHLLIRNRPARHSYNEFYQECKDVGVRHIWTLAIDDLKGA